jgi:hypothetical protein
MVCSEAGAIDRERNAVSFFNVVEHVQLTRIPPGVAALQLAQIRPIFLWVVAAWLQSPEDTSDQHFEFELVLYLPDPPNQDREIVCGNGRFAFATPVHRLTATPLPVPGFFGEGIMRVESRIRRAGETEWLAQQDFPIALKFGPDQAPGPPDAAQSPPTS